MKKIIFKVEMTIAENCPNELPFSKETYANMITDCIRNETSKEEITDIKSEIVSSEGLSFKENV